MSHNDILVNTGPHVQRWLIYRSIRELKNSYHLDRGVKLTFTRGHISLEVAFKGLYVILGLRKGNCSSTRGKELGAATG